MSVAIKINGVTLVPIKEAATTVHYSRDYVARLAREGKIVASQIGRHWYVDLASLNNFSTAAVLHEEVRKRDLSTSRKNDLEVKEKLAVVDQKIAKRVQTHRSNAFLMTGLTLCLGLIAGVGTYTVSNLYVFSKPVSVDSLAQVLRPVVLPEEEVSPFVPLPLATEVRETMLLTTVMEQPVFTDEASVRALTGEMGGILILAANTPVQDAAAVARLFSDEVTVTFTDERSGVVSYEPTQGVVTEYPFVAIPQPLGERATTSTTVMSTEL